GADPELATALPARQQVRRSSTTIGVETLNEEVLAKLLAVLPLGVEVESVLGLRDVLVPIGEPRIEVKLGRLRRSTIVTVDVSVGTRRWATLRATVQLTGDAQTPVLVDELEPGTTVTDAHVQMRQVDLDSLPDNALVRADQLVGKRIRNRQRAAAPLRTSAAEELPIIARGAVVTMVSAMPGLRVTRKAVAQQEGAKGATIRVKLDDGTVLPVVVASAGEVHVAGIARGGAR
ncbi:MAG: flagellar basal body P-ring formation protein FlgA, partial [Deltaproteobacteria bacterium]|nr:flagellar basal body P-ring formation protein FlgA [Nannocystaceae bacterium]